MLTSKQSYMLFMSTILFFSAVATVTLPFALEYQNVYVLSLEHFNFLSVIISNFSHAGLIHLAMNMLFLYEVYKIGMNIPLFRKHVFIVTIISIFAVNLGAILLMTITKDSDVPGIVGFSGVLFALLGLVWGNVIKATVFGYAFLIGYQLVFIFILDINLAWEAHLIGFIIGFIYQLMFIRKTFLKLDFNTLIDHILAKNDIDITVKNFYLHFQSELMQKKLGFHYFETIVVPREHIYNDKSYLSDSEMITNLLYYNGYRNNKLFHFS